MQWGLFLANRKESNRCFFLYYSIHPHNLFYLFSTLGKSFSITSTLSQQAGQIHTKTGSNILLPAAQVPVSILFNLNFASARSVQAQKSSGPERSTMNSKLTPPQSTTSDGINIFLCSTGHKTFLKMLQEKAKSQKSIHQWKRAAENKGIISALGPWNSGKFVQ